MNRGTGYRDDDPVLCAKTFDDVRAELRVGALPTEHEGLLPLVGRVGVFEQGLTSSCLAARTAKAIQLLVQRDNALADAPLPSVRFIYDGARAIMGERNLDRGSYDSALIRGVHERGWCTDEHMPWSDANALDGDDARRLAWICERPGITARHHAHDQRDALDEYAIATSGDVFKDDVKRSIVSLYPVGFACTVTAGMFDIRDLTPIDLLGEPRGGHGLLWIAYSEVGPLFLNSWSSGWGFGGIGQMTWEAAMFRTRSRRVFRRCARATS